MRTILFAGKKRKDGLWITGTMLHTSDDTDPFIVIKNKFESYQVDPETICQYTGMNDRLGTMIFEGDRVYIPLIRAEGIVKFIDGCFEIEFDEYIEIHGRTPSLRKRDYLKCYVANHDVEVIAPKQKENN